MDTALADDGQQQQRQSQAQADVARLAIEAGRGLPGFTSTGPSPPPSQVRIVGPGLISAMQSPLITLVANTLAHPDSMASADSGLSQGLQGPGTASGDGGTQLTIPPDGATSADPFRLRQPYSRTSQNSGHSHYGLVPPPTTSDAGMDASGHVSGTPMKSACESSSTYRPDDIVPDRMRKTLLADLNIESLKRFRDVYRHFSLRDGNVDDWVGFISAELYPQIRQRLTDMVDPATGKSKHTVKHMEVLVCFRLLRGSHLCL